MASRFGVERRAEGTTSAVFAAEICPFTDWDKDVCHNGTWHSVSDYSDPWWSHWSRSRTLACEHNGRARHYYRFGGIWYETIDGSIPPNNVYVFTKESGSLLPRAINHCRTSDGFVRGSSHFQEL